MSEDKKSKINLDEDFIDCTRFKNSVKKLIEKHPDGVDDETICKVLCITQEELSSLFSDALIKIRKELNK
jgi:hypothetical protein